MNTQIVQMSPMAVTDADQALEWKTYAKSEADEALLQWRTLASRIGDVSITAHPDWVDCWIRSYGDLVPYHFLALKSADTIRGITLITEGVGQKDGPFPIRTRHLGTAGEPQVGSICVEYNRLLVEDGFQLPFISGISQAIHQETQWESFCIDGMEESELQHWQAQFPKSKVRSRESKYFDFSTVRDEKADILSQLGKSTRSNIRRRLKKYGTLETEWASNFAAAEEIFAELVELHQARWNAVGEPGAFANPRFLSFQQQLLARLFSQNRVVLFRVRHDGETVGCLFLLVDQNRLLDYLSGFAAFDEKPSIGLLSHYLCMEEALQRGYAAYDFLVGDKQHKNNLSNRTAQLCWLQFQRPTLKTKTIKALRNVKQFLQSNSPLS